MERSHCTDEEEFYRHLDGTDLTELAQRIAPWETDYSFARPHLSLKGQTLMEALLKAAVYKPRNVQEVS